MIELSFRGKDRYRPSWLHLGVLCLVLAVEGVFAAYRLGPAGFGWVLGGTLVLVGLATFVVLRSWTTVDASGITICWGLGRGRTYPWHEIRWIDIRETDNQYGYSLVPRIYLTNGRRRSLPGLQHSDIYPSPDFQVDFQRILNWWELSTDPSIRVQPSKQLRDRVGPMAVGMIAGLLIAVVVGLVFVLKN
ncbi:hypothetical protein OG618_14390 [Kitasatospora sp. NBC_01246]|uniref:hypothetical protein n=1 Tax=Kitasatospora sp. NBC_01246 TaxID=2903570 RepID=UPI002E364173|nr:hypothetical protein [Kitasatospora sp. NBC_01246]